MTRRSTQRCLSMAMAVLFLVLAAGAGAFAGTTGTISGTVTDAATGKAITGLTVAAASPSQQQQTTTNGAGFYVLQNLGPDTYTVTISGEGYDAVTVSGVTVQQDQTFAVDQRIAKKLQTIGRIASRAPSNLVNGTQGTDVYNISGQQLAVASGGDDLHKTLYEYISTAPGITTNGFPGLPRIRGGTATDTGYEFDGIPTRERITGLFTSNLSNAGLQNVEVYTGGLSAANADNGSGIINAVVKTGTSPGFTTVAAGFTGQDYNHYLTIERGGATRDGRLSYYVTYDGVNSQNQYDHGKYTFPNILYNGFNGPGTVSTRDIIGNFHYRPSQKDDIQFLVQNGVGEFNYNYLLNGPGTRLALAPCGGNSPTASSPTGFGGGTAPNGSACPSGFYFRGLDSANSGNIWHHYSGLGKLQWNHLLNDHSAFTVRLAENFNQYIFDQPLSDANYAWDPNPFPSIPATQTTPAIQGCPAFPYTPGTPVPVVYDAKNKPHICSNETEVFYGDRRSNMWFGSLDYTTTPNAHSTYRAGIGQEYDDNMQAYYNTYAFNADGTWPQHSTTSIVPTHFPYVYVDGTFNTGRFTLEPGLRYSEGIYMFPGSQVLHHLTPTFAGTYRASARDVLRYSYSDTSNYVGTVYVYRQFSTTYDPNQSGGSYAPQVNHNVDFMWERQFDRATSLKVGPYARRTTNYYSLYKPFLGFSASGVAQYGPTTPTSAGANNIFGVELGLNHTDTRNVGMSFFLSGNYENYWTTSISSLAGSYGQSQLPSNLVAAGVRIRSTDDPLFNGSLAIDMHAGQWSLYPLFVYQMGTFYNVGIVSNGQITQNELIAGAHWVSNLSLLRRLDKKGKTTIGVRITNLFNNLHDTTPCKNGGTGCSPFNGAFSGVTPANGPWIYQDYTQNPRQIEVFGIVKQ